MFLTKRLSIQSRLILLLVASFASLLTTSLIGYTAARDALRDRVFEQLTGLREARAETLLHHCSVGSSNPEPVAFQQFLIGILGVSIPKPPVPAASGGDCIHALRSRARPGLSLSVPHVSS